MRGKSRSRVSSRASKRKREKESESSSTSEPKSKRPAKRREIGGQKVDNYCWLCHTEADDKICKTCQRAFHDRCLKKSSASFNDDNSCPECISISVDGTALKPSKFFNLNILHKMLDVVVRRVFGKKKKKNERFMRWPEEERSNLFKIVDLEIMLDNVNHCLSYTKTSEFYADVKFMYHNACIAYGVDSDEAKIAENLRRDFKAELLDLEACPECYFYLYCDESDRDAFVRLCELPHDIVWAQLTGHPYWPAKSLKVVKGIAHVRFFGEHEQSNIPISKCLFMSESHPKDKNSRISSQTNSGPKSQRYKAAKTELLQYIHLYRRKYGTFPFHPHKTPYKPQEKQNKVPVISTVGSCSRHTQMKLEGEGSMSEDSEMYIISATDVVDSEENLPFPNSVTSDIPTRNGSGTEGQYPSYNELQPSIGLSPSTSQCQYETLVQLSRGVLPNSAGSLPSQDNLIKNPSVVTSIDMTFSTHESNIENANPVVTAVGQLPGTVSAALSSVSENEIHHTSEAQNFRELLDNQHRMAETVHNTEILTEIVANSVPNDSSIDPNSLHNIVNNLPTLAGSQTEVDNEVVIIEHKRNAEAAGPFNPDMILPVLMEDNPELQKLVQQARYLADAMIVHLWAGFCKNPDNMKRISKLYVDLRKYKSDLDKANVKIDELLGERDANRRTIQEFSETQEKQNGLVQELEAKLRAAEFNNAEAAKNAHTIIRNISSGCNKKVEAALKQYMDTIQEKDNCISQKTQKLQESDERVKNVEEEIRRLKKELEELKVEKQKIDNKLQATKYQVPSDDLIKYKRYHYCWVCERPAAITCCINTSYCSEECQRKHADEHKKSCKKSEGQSYVLQTVSSQTVVYSHKSHGVITSERPVNFNPSTSKESSQPESVAGSSQHKKAQIHRVASSPPPEHDHPSSRSCSSKSKKRYR